MKFSDSSMKFMSNSCTMYVSYTCWYDEKDVVAPYIAAYLHPINYEDSDGCNFNATIVTPLACSELDFST